MRRTSIGKYMCVWYHSCFLLCKHSAIIQSSFPISSLQVLFTCDLYRGCHHVVECFLRETIDFFPPNQYFPSFIEKTNQKCFIHQSWAHLENEQIGRWIIKNRKFHNTHHWLSYVPRWDKKNIFSLLVCDRPNVALYEHIRFVFAIHASVQSERILWPQFHEWIFRRWISSSILCMWTFNNMCDNKTL